MKRTLLLLAVALSMSSCATTQVPPVADPSIEAIIESGVPAADGFDLSMRWVAQAFRSAKSVIEYSDRTAGTISAKGTMTVPGGLGMPVDIRFSLVIDHKDGRARLVYTALEITATTGLQSMTSTSIHPKIFEAFEVETNKMTESYRQFLKSSPAKW